MYFYQILNSSIELKGDIPVSQLLWPAAQTKVVVKSVGGLLTNLTTIKSLSTFVHPWEIKHLKLPKISRIFKFLVLTAECELYRLDLELISEL